MSEEAGIYCRLSLAIMGDTTKVDDQERICRELAAARGWQVRDEFVWKDNGKSAWRIGVRRPGWEAMLDTVRAGNLKNLIVYHGDRMVRQPYDLEVLIRLATGGMTITSPTGTRRLDVAEDVFVLGILANVARLESENTSRRKKAGFSRMYLAGRAPVPGGQAGRGYGYQADGRTPHPAEAQALRTAAARALDGEPLTVIARDMPPSTSGRPMSYWTLKRILTRPRIAGLLADGTPGTWEPILDRDTFGQLGRALNARTPHHGGGAKYLLSGIAVCSYCEQPVQRQSAGKVLGYGCVTPGCRKIHRNMQMLDDYVGSAVVGRLNHPANPPGLIPATPGLAAQLAALATARAEVASRVADPGTPHLPLLLARLDAIDQRTQELLDQAGEARTARLLRRYGGLTWEGWLALPLPARRALVTALFRVVLLPASGRGPGFRPGDVDLTPR